MSTADKTDYKQLLSFMMENLRHINAMIREHARLLSIATRGNRLDEPSLRHHSSIVFEQAAVLSSWLAIVDMYVEPDRFAKEPTSMVSVHGIFFKACVNFKRLAADKKVCIKLHGNGKFLLNAHPVIEIMPYILFDNALKYSLKPSEITVTLDDDSSNLRIRVQSLGPCLENGESGSLCTVGFRGKYAKQRTAIGTGQGLALLKRICDCHAGSIVINSKSSGQNVNDIPYGWFTVDISLPTVVHPANLDSQGLVF